MALTKEIVIDKIEIVGIHKMVQVRKATVVKEDGVELSRTYSRHVVAPNADTTGEDVGVQDLCNVVHTAAVKTAYKAMLDAQAVAI